MTSPESAALERADEHIFLCGVDDAAERLCRLNMQYGLAKIHHYQQAAGWPADATFVGAPDATVTRNENRWVEGIGYGGKIEWTGPFAILDLKLNGCGVLMGRLPKSFNAEEVRRRLEQLSVRPLEVDGVRVDWDLHAGNHFLELVEPMDEDWALDWKGPAFLMHSSGHEHRAATARGPGLYWDRSDELRGWAEVHPTPWGVLRVLTGEHAEVYHQHCLWVQRFHMRRRAEMAEAIFGRFEKVFEGTHQGLIFPGGCHLGCYCFGPRAGSATVGEQRSIFPMTLSRDLPVFLLKSKSNFSESAIAQLGWESRAKAHSVTSRLLEADLLPHGSGYAYPWMGDVDVRDSGAKRTYLADSPGGQVMFSAPRVLPHTYRGTSVLSRTLDLGMADVVGKMRIIWCIGGGA